MADPEPRPHVDRRHPLLGTVVEVVVRGTTSARAAAASAVVFDEIDRLEAVLSAYRDDSELSAWKRDEVARPSTDLSAVMSAALDWQRRSQGSFNPLAGELTALWEQAQADGRTPSSADLHDAVRAISEPRYVISDGVPRRTGDCGRLNFNAIAKGYIVDRAIGVARSVGEIESIVVNAGGDIAHRGRTATRIGIENPLRPFDNEPPIAFVDVRDESLATSGGSRRGVVIGGRRYSHVIDPRTGEPVDTHASISVVAPTAMEADVLATVAGAMAPNDAAAYIEAMPRVGCLVIERSGRSVEDSTWARHASRSS